jgi:uncharacterized protein YkwD
MLLLALLLSLFAICQTAAAQNIQPRPVARLISEPTAASGYARPRRVKPEESVASTNTTSAVRHSAEAAASNLPSLDDATPIERRAFEQTNQARVENGLPEVEWDSELCRMARDHSEKMAQQGMLTHQTPEGMQLKERARRNGILHFRVIGENLAFNKGYKDPGAFAVERWLGSSGHRANILYVGFQAAAIGSYVAADGSVYLTQVFIAR